MKRLFIVGLILFVVSCTATNQANKFYDAGDYDAAIAECKQILETDSTNVDAYLMLGRCYQVTGKLKDAVNTLSEAYNLSASTPKLRDQLISAKLQYGDSLIAQDSKAAALEQLKSAVALDTTNVPGILRLADFYVKLGFHNQALKQYKRILKQDEKNTEVHEKITELNKQAAKADSIVASAKVDFEKYRYQKAIKETEKAIMVKPDHKDGKYYHSMSKGALLYKKGKKSTLWGAIEEFGKAMAIRPNSGEPHYYMGLSYEKKDKREV